MIFVKHGKVGATGLVVLRPAGRMWGCLFMFGVKHYDSTCFTTTINIQCVRYMDE